MGRMLRFLVNGQKLIKDPKCDFTGIVKGSKGFLSAEFVFDSSWHGCIVAASFWHLGNESAVLLKKRTCVIPDDALDGYKVGVSLTGIREDGYKIVSNRVYFEQEG